jgi:hypothetical protein
MKRISILLMSLGFSLTSLAALPAATEPTEVSVPQLPGGFFIGATGYYLHLTDTNGDLNYAIVNSVGPSPFSSQLKNIEPGYDWGWGINAGYIFPQTGNDVEVSYFNYDNDESSSVNSPLVVPILGIDSNGYLQNFIAALDARFADTFTLVNSNTLVSAKAKFDLEQIDATAGQFINVGCRLILHPKAGVRWASIDRTLDSNINTNAAIDLFLPGVEAGTIFFTADGQFAEKSSYDGIGPLVGLDSSYYIGYGFGAVAHFDTALLVGNIDSNSSADVDSNARAVFTMPPGLALSFARSFAVSNQIKDKIRVVPVIDAKLGADYTFLLNNPGDLNVTVEAGWQVSDYFNAIDKAGIFTTPAITFAGRPFIDPLVTIAPTLFRRTSDLLLSGPYANVIVHF